MKKKFLDKCVSMTRKPLLAAALAAGLLAVPAVGHAQQAVIVGFLGNFDVLNNTGEQAHGFEIQMEGVHAADIYRIFGAGAPFGYPTDVIRYGQGTATDYATGVYVRWMSPWDPATQTFKLATPIPATTLQFPAIPVGASACHRPMKPTAVSISVSAQ